MRCQSPLTRFLRERMPAVLLKQTAIILTKVLVIESMRKMNSESITLATILFNEQTYLSLLIIFSSQILRERMQLKTFPAI